MHHFDSNLIDLGPAPNTAIQYNRARHYDPQHGRWLQRDPLEYVEWLHLYEYMRMSPTRGTDALGLSARERWAVTDAISREIGAHRGQLYYRNGLTDLPWLLNTLITDVRNSRWSDGDFVLNTTLGPTAARSWAGPFTDDRMEIGSLSTRPLTVVHEAVHLRHSLLGVYQGIRGYAVEGDESVARGTELMIGGVDTLRKWERRVRGGIRHEEDCKRVKGMWRIFWQSMNQILGSQSMTSGGGGIIDSGDIYAIERLHGFHLSCRSLADAYNRLIQSYTRRGRGSSCSCELRCSEISDLALPFD
jgi:hypothetical protein